MPRHKRNGAKGQKRRAKQSLAAMRTHVLEMEEPLRETGDLIRALCLMGDGLRHTGEDDNARAVSAVAWITLRRANVLQNEWRRLAEAGRPQ